MMERPMNPPCSFCGAESAVCVSIPGQSGYYDVCPRHYEAAFGEELPNEWRAVPA